MKEDLIKLALEKKFSSTMLFNYPYKYSHKEPIRWCLWMCELQKWLREVHNIHISVYHFWDFTNNIGDYQAQISQIDNEVLNTDFHGTYELAFEEGLTQALKLI